MEDEYIEWLKKKYLESNDPNTREDWVIAVGHDLLLKGVDEFDFNNVVEQMRIDKAEQGGAKRYFQRALEGTIFFQVSKKASSGAYTLFLNQEGKMRGNQLYDDFLAFKRKRKDFRNRDDEIGNPAGQIVTFKIFFEEYYEKQLCVAKLQHDKKLVVDFNDLLYFNHELAEMILDQPEELIKAMEIAVAEIHDGDVKGFNIRFINLPKSQNVSIRNIRSIHIGKLFSIEGTIRQKTDVRPQITTAKYECPSCGNYVNIIQLETTLKEPTKCSCGRKGHFRLLLKELVDAQGMVIEEPTENLETTDQPKKMNAFLKEDLVSPISEKRYEVGSRINIIGIVKEVPILLRSGGKSTRLDLIIDANNLEVSNFEDMTITPEEEEQIKNFAKSPDVFKQLVNSIAPSIYGHETVKEGVILQLAGGVRKQRLDGTTIRGDMHILLVGDPGTAKSQLTKRISVVAPKARWASGTGSSAKGITAAVIKSEFLGGFAIEAGAMVLANDGLLCIEEIEKASPEDLDHLHTGMEQQLIYINRGGINATLTTRCSILASANPKHSRFDQYGIISDQISLKPTLINRFDLIYIIKDVPDTQKDHDLAKHILSMHRGVEKKQDILSNIFLRKYFYYIRKNCHPILTEEAEDAIVDFYLKLRNDKTGNQEIKTVPINPRQIDGLARLSEAVAKLRLADKVTADDAKKAVEIMHSCLMAIGFDKETGKIDIDRIETGFSASQRNKINIINEILKHLEESLGKNISIENIVHEGKQKGLAEEHIEETIEKMKRAGDIFEPKRGFISRIG